MERERIHNPKALTVVRHTGWRYEEDPNYPCDVLIIDGEYMGGYGRVSNYWYWRRILKDGSLGPIENGYGSFEVPDKEYDIEIKVIEK